MINTIFKQINYDIFGDQLYPIEIILFECIENQEAYGLFVTDDIIDEDDFAHIVIHNDLTWFDGWCTIAHELIHYKMWSDFDDKWEGHGKTFKKHARRIEKFYNLKTGTI